LWSHEEKLATNWHEFFRRGLRGAHRASWRRAAAESGLQIGGISGLPLATIGRIIRNHERRLKLGKGDEE